MHGISTGAAGHGHTTPLNYLSDYQAMQVQLVHALRTVNEHITTSQWHRNHGIRTLMENVYADETQYILIIRSAENPLRTP